jgi:hypothetical protein
MRTLSKAWLLIVLLGSSGLCHGSTVRDVQHELGIDDSHWKVANETDTQIAWSTDGQEGVTLMLHGDPSDVHDPNDQKALQDAFRDEAKHMKGGLVEVEPFTASNVKCVLVTMKFRESTFGMKSDGFAYQLNAIIPTRRGDIVLQVAAIETGTTGMRESLVTILDMKQRNITDLSKEGRRFRRDPYDAKYDADALYMISDDRKWDDVVPNYPLTRARKLMDSLIKSLKIGDPIRREALFKG